MQRLRLSILLVFAAALALPLASSVEGQAPAATEAPTTTMDRRNDEADLWNGLGVRGRPIDECEDEPEPNRSFEDNKFIFRERETPEEGLGPIYNGVSCDECHQQPVTGGVGQQREIRAGNFTNGVFTQASGGNVIHMRSTIPNTHEHLENSTVAINTKTFRTALILLGDGFVEAIPNERFTEIRNAQPAGFQGTIIQVPMLEAPGRTRVGRFGWKAQEASLVSFSTAGYLNELGITTPLAPTDNTSMGRVVNDGVADPEDDGADAVAFANFIRATRAPGRGPINAQVQRGDTLFRQIGCANCHTPSIVTAPTGTVINGGTFTVPAALGNKIIRPFSDFMLHDIGTGDGLVQQGGAGTRNQMRTPPLWGLRARNFFMHDGQSSTVEEAILRHGGPIGTPQQGSILVRQRFVALSAAQKADLTAFLLSL